MGDPDSCSNLAALFRSCPNLRNLQIGYEDESFVLVDNECTFEDVSLPNLEFYYSQSYGCVHQFGLLVKLLVSGESLRYLGANLGLCQIPELHTRDRMQHAFGNLVALDLATYSIETLDILAEIDDLQLRYFRLGDRDGSVSPIELRLELAREADVLSKIIGKLRKLEMFIAVLMPLTSNNSIKNMTSMKLNLKLAAFAEYSSSNYQNEMDGWEPNVVAEFGKMLMSNDPGLDLSQFCLVVKEDNVPQKFRDRNTGLTFFDTQDVHSIRSYDVRLVDLGIKRKLGINF